MTHDGPTLPMPAARATEDADKRLGEPPTELQDAARAHFKSGAAGGVTGDIGCGAGRDVDWLERHGYPCSGFEASEALLAEAERRFPERRFAKAALPALDEIAPRTFDNLVCESVLAHLPRGEIADAVRALRRILVADGVLYLRWRARDVDLRGERVDPLATFDASLVLDALAGMTILHSGSTTGSASDERIHTAVARARGNAFNRKPRRDP